MADQVKCLYCGANVPADSSHCPGCGAVSHFQRKGYRAGARRRFLVWLLLLTIFSIFMAFWLPR
ncbi:MAG TPA: protein nirD [Thiolapillus brandeum]|uniref:Protein nirD n=1 Tax=Thiolapillus brandeum TaxID=1076588 RepID=A0A7C5MZR8_9GAMM|nr:protein nirD [Thiolapillus brandeum]